LAATFATGGGVFHEELLFLVLCFTFQDSSSKFHVSKHR
jgi:hypothetical protein